jgi:hypothetical protein
MADGASATDTARAALAELGAAENLAASMAAEVAPWSAHRTGLLVVVGGPVVGWRALRPARRRPARGTGSRRCSRFRRTRAVPAALIALTGAGLLRRRLPALGSASVVVSMWAGAFVGAALPWSSS